MEPYGPSRYRRGFTLQPGRAKASQGVRESGRTSENPPGMDTFGAITIVAIAAIGMIIGAMIEQGNHSTSGHGESSH